MKITKKLKKSDYHEGFDEDFSFETKSEKIEWNNISENYEIENLYELENNSELVRIEMNTIEFPLFTKNKRIGNNAIMTYEFNHTKNQFLRITPVAGNRIPGEFEEKIFFALMKLYKRNGHNQTIFTDFYTLISEMRLEYSGTILRNTRKGLKNLGGSTYEFNNLFYSNERAGIVNDNMVTTMFSISIIEFKDAKEITNPDMLKAFRNSKIKEIIQIKFSGHFYENVIRRGYLYFDRQDLLQIENSVSRTLFMMLTKWRNKELYVKRYSRFLASRIPLSWKKNNISGTLKLLKEAFEDLKVQRAIKNYKFNNENGGANSYFEIWFDKEHNRNYIQVSSAIESVEFQEQEDYEITNQLKETLLDDMSSDMPIIESETTKQLKELLNLMPEKARTLKTLEGKIEKSLKKKGYEYTKGAVLYTAQNAKASFGKYLTETLEKNWHEEFQQKLIQEEEEFKKKEKKAKKAEKEEEKEKALVESKQQIKDKAKELFGKLSDEKKSELEKLALEDYVSHGETPEIRKSLKDFFKKMKSVLTLEYLIKVDYFQNKDSRKEEIEPAIIVQKKQENNQPKPKNIIQIEKLYDDIISLKVELHDYLYGKLSEQTLRQVMSFLNIESHYRREVENHKIEIKYVENGKSLIYIEKLN